MSQLGLWRFEIYSVIIIVIITAIMIVTAVVIAYLPASLVNAESTTSAVNVHALHVSSLIVIGKSS